MKATFLITGIFLFFLGCSLDEKVKDIEPVPQYRLTFTAFWSEETHPVDFPSNPHFSGLIGMVHNEEASLFREGEFASEGIKEMAEKGKKEPLDQEIGNLVANNKALHLISGNFLSLSPGEIMHEFEVAESHSLVSIVSMIAPSPDWFVAVTNVQLIENNEWVDQKTVDFSVYDAGTDSGISYTSENQATIPRERISNITTLPLGNGGNVPLLGIVFFERIYPD